MSHLIHPSTPAKHQQAYLHINRKPSESTKSRLVWSNYWIAQNWLMGLWQPTMKILKHTEDDILMIHHTQFIHILVTLIFYNNMFLLVLFFSMNINNMPGPHRVMRPLDSTSWYEICPAHTGSRGSMILMPGPHRVMRQLHNRPNTDNHKQLGQERQQPTSEHPCRYSRRATIHTKNTKYTCAYYTNIKVCGGKI